MRKIKKAESLATVTHTIHFKNGKEAEISDVLNFININRARLNL